MRASVALLPQPAPAELPFEIVERKGLGHPDSICDALAENLSIELSRYYLDRFGAILHHNVDKALLYGGSAAPEFGGGRMLEAIEIYLAGRATREFRGVAIPVDEIAIEHSREWIRSHLRTLDPQRDVRIHPRIRPTSPDLAALFLRQQQAGQALANDTSLGTGFAPLDALERAVMAAEQALAAHADPAIGEDVKVMGMREGNRIRLTVACAVVGRHVADLEAYRGKKELIRRLATEAAVAASRLDCAVQVNTADGDSPDSVYLTVTGLSAESGDDGQVGRGNRANGLITPCRPMSLEAAAGKNPVTHVGKLYNIAAGRIARSVVEEIPAIPDAACYLVSGIGQPITEPQIAEVQVRLAAGASLAEVSPRVTELLRDELQATTALWREIVSGTVPVC